MDEPQTDLLRRVAGRMTPPRFAHAERVAEVAAALAARHGLDAQKAYLAGILHDIARDVDPSLLLQTAISSGIVKPEEEIPVPLLLHGPVAAFWAARDFGISDPDVLEAIALHSTGAPGMSRLAQVVYVADAVEPGRSYPEAAEGRRLAAEDLAAAVAFVTEGTLRYLQDRGQAIDPRTVDTYNAFRLGAGSGGR
ncbi:MAG: bis(5'-nucleosyl)-tetraphosphatase (symmetrical) YqeK [Chitinophagales bacterium]